MENLLQGVDWAVVIAKVLGLVLMGFMTYVSPKLVSFVAAWSADKEAETHNKWLAAAIAIAREQVLFNYEKFVKVAKKKYEDDKIDSKELKEIQMEAFARALAAVTGFVKAIPGKAGELLLPAVPSLIEAAVNKSKSAAKGVSLPISPFPSMETTSNLTPIGMAQVPPSLPITTKEDGTQ